MICQLDPVSDLELVKIEFLNKNGHKIYGFNVSDNSPNYSLGGEISNRLKEGKKPFSRFSSQVNPDVNLPNFSSLGRQIDQEQLSL